MKQRLLVLMMYNVMLYSAEPNEQYVVSDKVNCALECPTAIAISPDGKLGALMQGAVPQSTLYLWDACTGQQRETLEVGDDDVYRATLQFTRDGKIFYAGYASQAGLGVVKFATDSWQRTKNPISIPVNQLVSSILFYSLEKALAFIDGNVYLWKQIQGNQQYQKLGEKQRDGDLYAAFNQSGDQCVIGQLKDYENKLLIIHCDDLSIARELTTSSLIANLIWSPDKTKIAAVTTTAKATQKLDILLWDLVKKTNNPVSIATTLYDLPDASMTFSPDSNLIFVGNMAIKGETPLVVVYDLKNNNYLSLLDNIVYASIPGLSLPVYGLVATDFIDDYGTFKLCCGVLNQDKNKGHVRDQPHENALKVMVDVLQEPISRLKTGAFSHFLERLNIFGQEDSSSLQTSVMTIRSQAAQTTDFQSDDWLIIEQE